MIENICYCDKCGVKIKEATQYFKVDIYKRKWYSEPDEGEGDKGKGIPQRKLHLCEKCMETTLKIGK